VQVQGTGSPGGYDDPNAFSIAMYLTTGVTSRGRIGLDADLRPRSLQKCVVMVLCDSFTALTSAQSMVHGSR